VRLSAGGILNSTFLDPILCQFVGRSRNMFALLILTTTVAAQDYCAITPKHTACGQKGPGPSCNGGHLARGVTAAEIEEILAVHNRYRALVARGEERRGAPGPQPGAANMRQMVWDAELSVVAQAHADQCKFAHDCSDCRRVSRFGVGQNLYIYKQSLRKPDNNWEAGIRDWYEEVTLFSKDHVKPFKFSSPTGHYTALAWAETDKVGCGAASYKDGKWFTTLYTCNYGPGGNFIRGEMYKAGRACSECPSGTSCSKDFPGLCAAPSNSTTSVLPKGAPAPVNTIKTSRPKSVNRQKTTAAPRRTTTRRATTTRRPTTTTTFAPTTRRVTARPTTTTVKTTVEAKQTGRPRQPGQPLFSCAFEPKEKSCRSRNVGESWASNQVFGNHHYELLLKSGEKSEFFFKQLIEPPSDGIACLDFRYKKISSGGSSSVLTVFAWPRKGRPGRVAVVQDSPDQFTWVRAQVTFRNVDQQFLVMFRVKNKASEEDLLVAVDDVLVTEGSCNKEPRS